MNAKATRKLSMRIFKLRESLEKAGKTDCELRALFVQADKMWTEAYHLAQRRELEEAIRKDAGVVLWTLFFPREFGWQSQKVITRTPRRHIESLTIHDEVIEKVCWSDPWKSLACELERWPLDVAKLRERARMVDAKPRGFWNLSREAEQSESVEGGSWRPPVGGAAIVSTADTAGERPSNPGRALELSGQANV